MKQIIYFLCIGYCFISCDLKSGSKKNDVNIPYLPYSRIETKTLSTNPVNIMLEHWIESITGLPVFDSRKTFSAKFFTLKTPGMDIENYLISLNTDCDLQSSQYCKIQEASFEMVKEAKIRYKGEWYTVDITDIDYSTTPLSNPATGGSYYGTFFFVSDSVGWTQYSYKKSEGISMITASSGREIGEFPQLHWKIKGEIALIPVIMADVDFSIEADQIAIVSELILARNFSVTVSGDIVKWKNNGKESDNIESDSLVYGKGVQVLAFIYSYKLYINHD